MEGRTEREYYLNQEGDTYYKGDPKGEDSFHATAYYWQHSQVCELWSKH